jgi:hypothetical protein
MPYLCRAEFYLDLAPSNYNLEFSVVFICLRVCTVAIAQGWLSEGTRVQIEGANQSNCENHRKSSLIVSSKIVEKKLLELY